MTPLTRLDPTGSARGRAYGAIEDFRREAILWPLFMADLATRLIARGGDALSPGEVRALLAVDRACYEAPPGGRAPLDARDEYRARLDLERPDLTPRLRDDTVAVYWAHLRAAAVAFLLGMEGGTP